MSSATRKEKDSNGAEVSLKSSEAGDGWEKSAFVCVRILAVDIGNRLEREHKVPYFFGGKNRAN